MTYDLILGDYAYSSWSLRAWLLFDRFDIDRNLQMVSFKAGGVPEQMPGWAPAKTVPAMRTPEGAAVGESVAIAEELASRHPDLGLWPSDPKARAIARTLTAEMHAGFGALRTDCPMNVRLAYQGVVPRAEVEADLRRLELIWDYAREACAPDGPWLCGEYGIVDAFYAPVAARIAGYGLTVSPAAQAYVEAHLADPGFRRWRAMGLVHGETLNRYAMPYDLTDWPGPRAIPARAIETGTPENAACPYSGGAVSHLMEVEGRVFGFCNAFCRDKTVADPAAWPKFMALLG
ncbi:glutathione S-transferase [Roseovarius sp. 2305UL8-3]|uniref:glutathione S-transferase n=1 Tax=Roseovarius conchicola TaxID=3121636 RepID=UPI003527E971